MEWQDTGTILAVRRHGESAAIIEVFTAAHGRHAGIVRGGAGRKLAPLLQPGALMNVTWRARLSDHLGAFAIDPQRGRAAALFDDRLALAGLNAICGLLAYGLPERASYPELQQQSETLFDLLALTPAWPLAYLQWELALLGTLGFGLDLSRCAVTDSPDDLIYVSPRSGRAVSRDGAGAWADRLLPLPPCMLGQGDAPNDEIARALGTTGHFLQAHLTPRYEGQPFPPARARLIDLLARQSGVATNTI